MDSLVWFWDFQKIIEFSKKMQYPNDLDMLVWFLDFQVIIEFSRKMQNKKIDGVWLVFFLDFLRNY